MNKYLTTTLPYVNASPHMGHALEYVQADTLARHWRAQDFDVFFNSGVDEHGQKIARKADEAGISRQDYVDKYASEFDDLKSALNLSFDSFIRTTNPDHQKAAQHLWKLCDDNGDIYKQQYKGLYCVGCESFKVESDLDDGKCPDHQTVPEEIEEENYFFRLSKYQDQLVDYLSKEESIYPDWRRQEAIRFVESGLEDLSISRETKRMDWGVPVPDDDNHTMYVWFDALTNYISCLGWPQDEAGNFAKYWQNSPTLQLAGKDQIRFQSVIWQAMLMSAGVKNTDTIFYHGFINSNGQKMSKSLGNVIDPYELISRYGTDATRYLMLRHVHPVDDSDLTWDKLDEYYNANLVNGLGNLTARVMKMSETHLDYPVEVSSDEEAKARVSSHLEKFGFQSALDLVWHQIQLLDEQITITEPFKLVKTDKPKAQAIISELVLGLYQVADLLESFMPDTSEMIKQAVFDNEKPDNLFTRLVD
jgi:methionyl-tRNA synthetase